MAIQLVFNTNIEIENIKKGIRDEFSLGIGPKEPRIIATSDYVEIQSLNLDLSSRIYQNRSDGLVYCDPAKKLAIHLRAQFLPEEKPVPTLVDLLNLTTSEDIDLELTRLYVDFKPVPTTDKIFQKEFEGYEKFMREFKEGRYQEEVARYQLKLRMGYY